MACNSNIEVKKSCNKVILVEDNKAEADLTRIIFREQAIPIEIIHCQGGEEFFTVLEEIPQDEICYVLLDLNMPQMNGYEVLSSLSKNERWKNLVVIIFSSSSDEKDVKRCYEMGAKAYVTKPLDFNELDRTILAIHNFWGKTNEKPSLN